MTRASMFFLILVLVAALVLPGCGKKDTVEIQDIEPAEEIVPPPPPPPLDEPVTEPVVEKKVELQDVFFDYDKFNIRDEFKKVLAANAEILMDNPDVNLLVEGHCDERGTAEYNMALGEKRAKAVLDFFVAYGVNARRLSMVSYGEEKPFDAGQSESAWAKNRRAHMVVK